MSAQDHLSPHQFVGPWYHGTTSEFEPGEELTTRGAKQHLMANGVRPEAAQHRQIYVTQSLGMARTMATTDYERPGHVYRVEPTGPLTADPEVSRPGWINSIGRLDENPTQSYMTSAPVRVVRKVSR